MREKAETAGPWAVVLLNSFSNKETHPRYFLSLENRVENSDLGGRVGNVARVVKQSRMDLNRLRGAVLGEARKHVVVGVVVDECERVHRSAILEQDPSPKALVFP